MTNDNLTYINPSTRQFAKRPSPLAAHYVAPGHYYDENTGLVKPVSTAPTSAPPARRGKK